MQRQVHFNLLLTDDGLERLALFDRDALEFLAVTVRVFATLAGVAFAAYAVHGHGQRGMRLGGDGTQRHGAGGKTFNDFFGRLDLVDRDRLGRINPELEQAAQRHVATVLVVDQLSVFLVGAPVVGARGVLQLGNRIGRPHVLFTACAPGVFTTGVQHGGEHRVVAKRSAVHAQGFFGNLEHAHAFDLAGGAGEVLGDGGAVQADGFKQLRAAVAHVGAHAHLGHDF